MNTTAFPITPAPVAGAVVARAVQAVKRYGEGETAVTGRVKFVRKAEGRVHVTVEPEAQAAE